MEDGVVGEYGKIVVKYVVMGYRDVGGFVIIFFWLMVEGCVLGWEIGVGSVM